MPTFTITNVDAATRDWQAHGKNNRSWRCDLERSDGEKFAGVEIARQIKADGSVKAPIITDRVEGELEDRGDYGLKFKPDYSGSGGGGGGGGGGSSWTPEREAAVEESHAQHMALRYAQVKATAGQLPNDFKPGEHLVPLIDFFRERVQAAAAAAKQ